MEASIIITNRPQTCAIGILTNHRWERPVALNLGHLDFEIVSDFDIRISDFRLSAPLSLYSFLPSWLSGYKSIMQRPKGVLSEVEGNKANFKMGNINISPARRKAYANEQ